MKTGRQLKALRQNLGLSQQGFASLWRLGRSATVSRYEKGQRDTPLELITVLANQLLVSYEWLLEGNGEMFDRGKRTAFINKVHNDGITSINDIQNLSLLFRDSYEHSSPPYFVNFLIYMIDAFLHLAKKAKNISSLLPGIVSLLPGKMSEELTIKNLDDNMHVVYLTASLDSATAATVKSISNIFLIIAMSGDLKLTSQYYETLNNKLMPWSYWIAKRAVISNIPPLPFEIDPDNIVAAINYKDRDNLLYETRSVSVNVFLSKDAFTGGFVFKQRPLALEFGCSSQSLFELIVAITSQKVEIISYGNWKIVQDPSHNEYYIQHHGTRVHVTQDEMNDFLDVTKKLITDLKMKKRLYKYYIDEYGLI